MLWDVSPLSWWEEKRSPEREIFYNAVIDVLEEALSSNNPACVESALHGLGHIQSSCIERVTEVITNYLKKVSVSTQLTTYAKQAILGNVQ
jgi:vesicle coat complex subunit